MKEGDDVPIKCEPRLSNRPSTIWLRAREDVGMEFIATFDLRGGQKANSPSSTVQFDSSKIENSNILILKSVKKEDSGVYGCAVIQGNAPVFGQMTKLVVGELDPGPKRSM